MTDPGAIQRHRALAAVAGVNAAAAWLGAAGLISGALPLGARVEGRLPFDSTVLAGVALASLVAVPLTALAWAAWEGDERTPLAASLVGVVLAGWILVQLVILRTVSFFHPVYLGLAIVLVVWGRRIDPKHRAGESDLTWN